ncbi:unnamed protein product [Caenorhabditis angaria]|uniref:Uncharacterized protein n=1 Tax=Caenorhabditis angaria TaxID=860376 RepID=A0A9P1N0T1_9PELO|nr:unnamed protein product [Caenorhabditis angaria]
MKTLLSIILLLIRFDKSTQTNFTINVQVTCKIDDVWCVQILVLELDFDDYDGLKDTGPRCYRGAAAPKYTLEASDTSDIGAEYEIVVGYRHNCTDNGAMREFNTGVYDVSEYLETATIDVPNKDLHNNGKKSSILSYQNAIFKYYDIYWH